MRTYNNSHKGLLRSECRDELFSNFVSDKMRAQLCRKMHQIIRTKRLFFSKFFHPRLYQSW